MSFGKRMAASILAAVLCVAAASQVITASPEENDSSQPVQNDAYASLMTVQERLEAIESQKGESEAYLSELDSQLSDLSQQLTELQERYSAKRTELDLINVQLTEAEKAASSQRENMALRIQYMYENSTGNGLLEAVFSSGDFQDILIQASHIRDISEYDREMLEEYVAVCEEVEAKKDRVELEQKEIRKLEESSEKKRDEIRIVYEETLSDINELAATIEDGQEEEARLLASIQEQEEQLAVWFVPVEQQVMTADYYASQYIQPAAESTVEVPAAAGTGITETPTGETVPVQEELSDTAASAPAQEGPADTAASAPEASVPAAEESAEIVAPDTSTAPASTWDGPKLTRAGGVNQGPSGKETYYNLNMSGVVSIMRDMGNTDAYWVRDDGVKMLGDYVMVAADLEEHPRGSIVESSLGTSIVVDTGYLEKDQLDIAVAW